MTMNFNLSEGSHHHPDMGTCAMEAVSILAGESFSDHPTCVCPVIAQFVRLTNDHLPDDETRNRLLLPLLPRLIGTRDPSKKLVRGYLAADYAVRVFAAYALQAAGLPDTLSGLPEIVDEQTAFAAVAAARAVGAYYATRAAKYAALAADLAGYAAATDAATEAAEAAYYTAAGISVSRFGAYTVAGVHTKTVELIERMIAL